jgi:hypothetical protein
MKVERIWNKEEGTTPAKPAFYGFAAIRER